MGWVRLGGVAEAGGVNDVLRLLRVSAILTRTPHTRPLRPLTGPQIQIPPYSLWALFYNNY